MLENLDNEGCVLQQCIFVLVSRAVKERHFSAESGEYLYICCIWCMVTRASKEVYLRLLTHRGRNKGDNGNMAAECLLATRGRAFSGQGRAMVQKYFQQRPLSVQVPDVDSCSLTLKPDPWACR